MISFNQYHDEKLAFHKEMKISFSQCDIFQRLKLSELLAITSDAAVEDFYQRGISWKFLAEKDIAILVSRLAFRLHKIPKSLISHCPMCNIFGTSYIVSNKAMKPRKLAL